MIDFGTAGLGDSATDLACLINVLGESFLRRMAPWYPTLEEALERARFWAGTLELQWALHAVRANDVSWWVNHLGGARDVRPVGTRWA